MIYQVSPEIDVSSSGNEVTGGNTEISRIAGHCWIARRGTDSIASENEDRVV